MGHTMLHLFFCAFIQPTCGGSTLPVPLIVHILFEVWKENRVSIFSFVGNYVI